MDFTALMNNTKAIWLRGRQYEVNNQAGFTADISFTPGREYTLLLAGATFYRVFVNEIFIHYGPVRAPYDYMYFDVLDISRYLKEGENKIAVEVAGYNCNCLSIINVPSFIKAVITEDSSIIAATGKDGSFRGIDLLQREQRVPRYSFQRMFIEIYHLDNATSLTKWVTGYDSIIMHPVEEVETPYTFIERQIPLCTFDRVAYDKVLTMGTMKFHKPENYVKNDFTEKTETGEITGFRSDMLYEDPLNTLQDYLYLERKEKKYIEDDFEEYEYVLFDMGKNNSGFINTDILVKKDADIYLYFSETYTPGVVDFGAYKGVENIVKYELAAHEDVYRLQTFEAYGFKYLYIIVLKGKIALKSVGLTEYSYPNYTNAKPEIANEDIMRIFNASIETFRQNTVDVFMDCPARERAGWLCDSYFTAQAAEYFAGEQSVEYTFMNNFAMTKHFKYIPLGMLPMTYPGEDSGGVFIPQWAMWFVVQLEKYLLRSGDDKDKYAAICFNLVNYLDKFINEEGLLESLPGWNFVEWSVANDWVNDVNYPTNMLYSMVLDIVGRLYDEDDLIAQSRILKEKIISSSFDGSFFIDNACRDMNGRLANTGNKSEICQYYALFTGVADWNSSKFSVLRAAVTDIFGPAGRAETVCADISPAAPFIGYFLRMEVLLKHKCFNNIIKEVGGYFLFMAKETGTLWETLEECSSRNHGFASFAGVAILKACFGIVDLNNINKHVKFSFNRINLSSQGKPILCTLGTPAGEIIVSRKQVGDRDLVVIHLPAGYTAETDGHEDCRISFV